MTLLVQAAHRTTHTSVPPAHTWNQSVDIEPGPVLRKMREALNGWSVYREKKGELSHCQIWNTLMMMLLMLSDETVDLFDTQQMIHRLRTNILTEYRQTQICETSPAFHPWWTAQRLHALARRIKSPVLRAYLDHKFCIQNKPHAARNSASLFVRWSFPSRLN